MPVSEVSCENKKLGIYIHVPFCVSKCPYCSFASKPVGLKGLSECEEKSYKESVIKEINSINKRLIAEGVYDKSNFNDYIVDTIFFGGGTPSLLKAQTFHEILNLLSKVFKFAENLEITMEMNPENARRYDIINFHKAGINRLSLGAQSFSDRVLKMLGRVHDSNDILTAYKEAKKAGFDNISLDLMFAIPGQTKDEWYRSVEKTVELSPAHISIYGLQFEEGTKFYDDLKYDITHEKSDDEYNEMFSSAVESMSKSGYSHYEISNFAITGFECRHNLKYWSLDEYLGLGESSASYFNGFRWKNLRLYDGNTEFDEKHRNTIEENISEYIFTGLRKLQGININEFKDKFGENLDDIVQKNMTELQPFLDFGAIKYDDGHLRLTEKGINISNQIMSIFVQ